MEKVQVQRIAAKAIILNEKNEILILREARSYTEGTNHGKYQLPGGRIDVGESYIDGLRREVREETGLEVDIERPIFVSEWFPTIKGVPHQIIGIFFVCRAKNDAVILSSEHDHYVWNEAQQLNNYDMLQADRNALGLLASKNTSS